MSKVEQAVSAAARAVAGVVGRRGGDLDTAVERTDDAVGDGSRRPSGAPIATAVSPTLISEESAKVIGVRSLASAGLDDGEIEGRVGADDGRVEDPAVARGDRDRGVGDASVGDDVGVGEHVAVVGPDVPERCRQ